MGAGNVGTPPTNFDFATASTPAGSPPNNGFSTGDFTGWTLTGTPTVQSDGSGGYYAQLVSGQRVKSAAFTVGASAQQFIVRAAALASGTFYLKINVYSGATYGTTTTTFFTSCPSACTNWNTYALNAVPWQNQSIKVEVAQYIGDLKADDVGIASEVLTGWTVASGDKVVWNSGGPSGSYATSSTTLTSAAIALDSKAQDVSLDLKVEGSSGSYRVNLLSGASYGTTTQVLSGSQADSASWATKTFGVGDFAGQSVKIQIVSASGTAVFSVDNVGKAQQVLPGWTGTGINSVAHGQEGGLLFAAQVSDIKSNQISLSFASNGKAWAHIIYRMKSNFRPDGFDYGSTLSVNYGGTHVFQFGGDSQMHTVDIWLESYFPIPSTVTNPGQFEVQGAGVIGNNKPDVALIEVVDGPGQNRILGNPAAAGSLPPGLASTAPTTDTTKDPVDVVNGTYTQAHTDLAIPGVGVPLIWTRTYASYGSSASLGQAGTMGFKWTNNWQAQLVAIDSATALIRLPGNSSMLFYKVSGTWIAPTGTELTLVQNVGGDWSLTTAERLVYSFDSAGKWTSVKDRNNSTTTLAYNGSGQLATITDTGGRTLTLTYTAGKITSVTDSAGRTVSYAYDANNDLVGITDVLGHTVSYQYSGHLLSQGTDAKGNVFVRNTYDGAGRVVSQLDAAGGQTAVAYSTPGDGATRVTDQRGKTTTSYFDTSGRITDVKDHDGNVTTTGWDSNNNRTSVTNPLGKVWQYTYDAHHNVLTAQDPLLKTTTYTYNTRNDVVSATDPLGRATTYGYSAAGNLTSVTEANGKVTGYTVNTQGLATAMTDPLGHATTYAYDSYGNRTSVTNALSKTWSSTYDAAGRPTSMTDPLSHTTSRTYNAAGQLLTATDALGHVTTATYDNNANALTVSDPNGKVTSTAYNNKDLRTTLTDPAGGATTFAYDAAGNLTSKTDPRGKTIAYTYDNEGRLATETDPLSHSRSYAYDGAGRLTTRTDAKGSVTTYTYNSRDQVTNVAYSDSTSIGFAYDDAGHRTQMVDVTGTTTYAYDSVYRPTSVTFPGARTVGYAYDDAGRRTSVTYPGGSNQAVSTYDAADHLASVADWHGNTTSYSYDDTGRLTTATLPSATGVVSTYTYDNADRLLSISHVHGGTTIASAAYTLDNAGNRLQRVDQLGTQTYAYDNAYRLTSATYPGPLTTTYSYDGFGNRTQMVNASGTTTYAYDNSSRLTTVTPPSPGTPITYTSDNNGNLTARGADTFSWDSEDRMTSASVGGVAGSFDYRGDGLRNSRTTGGATTTFTWDVARGLPVILDDGAQYVYGAGLVAQVSGSNTYYYLGDGLGSVMATVHGSGTLANAYTYDVYGKTTSASGSQANDFQFAGQQTDPTGLQYLRARYYDPATGGFLSRDPLADAPGWSSNPFAYAGGNPTDRGDPSGLSPRAPDYCSSILDDSRPHIGCPHTGIPPSCGRYATGDCGDPIGDAIHRLLLGFCRLSPACTVIGDVTLESATGEYEPVQIKATQNAYKMLKANRWSAEDWNEIKRGTQYVDKNGNNVWLRGRSDGLFNWIVERPDGTVLSARAGQDVRQLGMARGEYEWIKK